MANSFVPFSFSGYSLSSRDAYLMEKRKEKAACASCIGSEFFVAVFLLISIILLLFPRPTVIVNQ